MRTDLYPLGKGFKIFLNQNGALAKYQKESQNFKLTQKTFYSQILQNLGTNSHRASKPQKQGFWEMK